MKIKTASDLKHAVEQACTSPLFFTRQNMQFYGDTMRNYGVRQARLVETVSGKIVIVYELVRRHPVKRGNQRSAFFDASTFVRVYVKGAN